MNEETGADCREINRGASHDCQHLEKVPVSQRHYAGAVGKQQIIMAKYRNKGLK